jgi:hypothetical protein
MSRVYPITVVCEGHEDEQFICSFLGKVLETHITRVTSPLGRGCGFDWVKQHFVQEVNNLRLFTEGRGVLGLMDEDGTGMSRTDQISDTLHQKSLPDINSSQGRCLLLAIRNIETWAYWLKANQHGNSVVVDEQLNYKNTPPPGIERLTNADWKKAGVHLHTLNHTQMPGDCPQGLVLGFVQLRAFVQAVRG